MISICEFIEFVENLEDSTLQIDYNLSKATYQEIELKCFTEKAKLHKTFPELWEDSIPKYINNKTIVALIRLKPPENIKNALLFMTL